MAIIQNDSIVMAMQPIIHSCICGKSHAFLEFAMLLKAYLENNRFPTSGKHNQIKQPVGINLCMQMCHSTIAEKHCSLKAKVFNGSLKLRVASTYLPVSRDVVIGCSLLCICSRIVLVW